ncbi:MAG: 30S ribosomal protein S20 [Verrucomicrobiota bacterium]
MANKKSAEKQARVDKRRRSINTNNKSEARTVERKIRRLAAEGKDAEASKLVPSLQSKLDKAVKKGALHANTAARRKTRVTSLLRKPAG